MKKQLSISLLLGILVYSSAVANNLPPIASFSNDVKGMVEEQERVLNELATRGNVRQQVKGKLDLARFYINEGRYTEALGLIDAVEFSASLPDPIQLQVTRHRIHAYFNLEMYQQVVSTYQDYATQWPKDAYRSQLLKLYDQSKEQLGQDLFVEPEMKSTEYDSTQN